MNHSKASANEVLDEFESFAYAIACYASSGFIQIAHFGELF